MWSEELDRTRKKLRSFSSDGKKMFVSSSFQTHSIPLLHIISSTVPDVPVYFLDTGFHFPETKTYRNQIVEKLGLDLRIVTSSIPKVAQRDSSEKFLFASDPDRCCYFNKVLPLEPILQSHDIWISGVRKDQTSFRKDLKETAPGIFDTIRYHPMLEWTSKMIWNYRTKYNLPEHPLDAKGYLSIGCVPCTRKWNPEAEGRQERWTGMTKEECGIHTEFTVK